MTRIRQPELTRASLLDAARRILSKPGTTLSLNAVAQEAGISKGGLMHHYPSKEHLLVSLSHALIDEFQELLARAHTHEIAEYGAAPGAWCRAYIEVAFVSDETARPLMAALAPLAELSELTHHFQDAQQFLIDDAETDGLPAARAHAIRLACDGLWLGYNAGMPDLSDAQRAAVKEELLLWTRF